MYYFCYVFLFLCLYILFVMFMYSYCCTCSVLAIRFHCFVLCTVLLPPGVNPIVVNKHIIYHIRSDHNILHYIISYHIISHIIPYHITYHINKRQTRKTNIEALSDIRSHDPNNEAPSDPRHKPIGHRDRWMTPLSPYTNFEWT